MECRTRLDRTKDEVHRQDPVRTRDDLRKKEKRNNNIAQQQRNKILRIMAKKNEAASEEVFYVGLSNPQEMRRNVLESMKDTILVLKTYDHLSKKRAEKVEKIIALKQVLGDIDALLSK